jgi:multidrug efflux pump subunit AcrB
VSTLAIIAAFAPLAFITGMMGPYMRPMALNVPIAVIVSTVVVAFLITPWLSMFALKHTVRGKESDSDEDTPVEQKPLYRFYRVWLWPILQQRWLCFVVLGVVFLMFVGSVFLPAFRVIPLKMLPFDNKNEFQVVIDMPEGATLEQTDHTARRVGDYLAGVAEVRDYEIYVGLSSPMDFNGMVRHYYLREGPPVADIRVNLAPKRNRAHRSHELVLRLRKDIDRIAAETGANIKLVEVPPGPPVMATITAEVYGPPHARYEELIAAGRTLADRFRVEPGVVDVDTSAAAPQTRWAFVTDKAKAALVGISTEQIAQTLQMALGGHAAATLHLDDEVDPLLIELKLPRPARASVEALEQLYLVGGAGQLVQLGTLGAFQRDYDDQPIYHKNLDRVVYVFAEAAGRAPADAIIDMQFDRRQEDRAFVNDSDPRPVAERTWIEPGGGIAWGLPAGYEVEWAGEGEWQITLDVFRDLGIAFGAALVLIFIILLFQTGSRLLPLMLMLAIPLEMIGVMPGFWLLNWIVSDQIGGYQSHLYFTATAMIGIIVLAGIVIRNSVLLLDFIQFGLKSGLPMNEAVLQSVAVRTRPILLTAATTLIGNIVITLDPIFAGLAWAIIFGITASNLFTLVVIPVAYVAVYGGGRSRKESPRRES